ncbi:hypothetical protein DIZ27_43125 [Streptomyces sp. NWU339]|uniref:hypothetical protein n=1 Tax=Streptomyces sp. NWU339 TaxID=2185284 RepID=UPI000D67E960|nr:hypothetical protein [Streptomyces sp. NWU339]PWI04797.1 hypothetical protein DIZ27_43125 [Streptomyces sp. NWU339]
MTSKAFWTEYFEDAYRDAAKKRREVIDRGLLLIAHLIREELPAATAITVNGSVLTTVRDGEDTIWRFNDEATSGKLSDPTRAHIRDTLLDMLTFYRFEKLLTAADWKPLPHLSDAFLVALPADPDRDQKRDAAPAANARPHGTPGEDAGKCAQCGRLLVWDKSGKRVNDMAGEYLCFGFRPAGSRSAVHVLTEPAAAKTQPAMQH